MDSNRRAVLPCRGLQRLCVRVGPGTRGSRDGHHASRLRRSDPTDTKECADDPGGRRSSLDEVVKVNAYVPDLTRFAQLNEVYGEFFRHDPPAQTTVGTSRLGFLVEID